ncbi:MAG: hypothetical protein INF93_11650 [Rhodobacter sp.]|nr:hypothetical protein [Rhodobacter sp.]
MTQDNYARPQNSGSIDLLGWRYGLKLELCDRNAMITPCARGLKLGAIDNNLLGLFGHRKVFVNHMIVVNHHVEKPRDLFRETGCELLANKDVVQDGVLSVKDMSICHIPHAALRDNVMNARQSDVPDGKL